jgi:hypothetical protein
MIELSILLNIVNVPFYSYKSTHYYKRCKKYNELKTYCENGDVTKINKLIKSDLNQYSMLSSNIKYYNEDHILLMYYTISYNQFKCFKVLYEYYDLFHFHFCQEKITEEEHKKHDTLYENKYSTLWIHNIYRLYVHACKLGHIDIIKYMVENCKYAKDILHYENYKGINIAFENNNVEVIKYLLLLPQHRDFIQKFQQINEFLNENIFLYILFPESKPTIKNFLQKIRSNNTKIFERDDCPVCTDKWNNTDNYKIKLSCGHLICVSCLIVYQSNCAICRDDICDLSKCTKISS